MCSGDIHEFIFSQPAEVNSSHPLSAPYSATYSAPYSELSAPYIELSTLMVNSLPLAVKYLGVESSL